MSITKKIQTFAHDLKMENSHLESPLTTKYFEKCSRGMAFLSLRTGSRLRGAQQILFQKWNDRFIDIRAEWLFWNNAEYIAIPE